MADNLESFKPEIQIHLQNAEEHLKQAMTIVGGTTGGPPYKGLDACKTHLLNAEDHLRHANTILYGFTGGPPKGAVIADADITAGTTGGPPRGGRPGG